MHRSENNGKFLKVGLLVCLFLGFFGIVFLLLLLLERVMGGGWESKLAYWCSGNYAKVLKTDKCWQFSPLQCYQELWRVNSIPIQRTKD